MKEVEQFTQAILQDVEYLKQEQLASLELISLINGLKRKQQEVIDRVTREVHAAMNEQGKKKYSNETIRNVAIREILAASEGYQTREGKIEELETTVQKHLIEQEYLRNKITINKEFLLALKHKNL
ncbi:MAG: hypothetical protein JSW11_13505 [Candidatus Heimdallarchaeota archaeon]|nr:MAG: hypothetical protein JSW11_13505 [Candidatus Heimdallarchaeota archaeon]